MSVDEARAGARRHAPRDRRPPHAELVRIPALVRERLPRQGMHPVGNTPAQFAAEVSADVERWARVVRKTGIDAE